MKLKLDENLGLRAHALFRAAGYDVETAHSEDLSGASDDSIFEACCVERRCPVTVDLDFADPIRFSAHRGSMKSALVNNSSFILRHSAFRRG